MNNEFTQIDPANNTSQGINFNTNGLHELEITSYIMPDGVNKYFSTTNTAWNLITVGEPPMLSGVYAYAGPLVDLQGNPASTIGSVGYDNNENMLDGDNKILIRWDNPSDIDLGLSNAITFSKFQIWSDNNGLIVDNITDRNANYYILGPEQNIANTVGDWYSVVVVISSTSGQEMTSPSNWTDEIIPFTFPTSVNPDSIIFTYTESMYCEYDWQEVGIQYASYIPYYEVKTEQTLGGDLVYYDRYITSGQSILFNYDGIHNITITTVINVNGIDYFATTDAQATVTTTGSLNVLDLIAYPGPLANINGDPASYAADVLTFTDASYSNVLLNGDNKVLLKWPYPDFNMLSGGVIFDSYAVHMYNSTTNIETDNIAIIYDISVNYCILDVSNNNWYDFAIQVFVKPESGFGAPVGSSNWTYSNWVIPFTFPAPLMIDNTSVQPGIDNTIIDLTWSDVTNQNNYNDGGLEPFYSINYADGTNASEGFTSTNYTLTGLNYGQMYSGNVSVYYEDSFGQYPNNVRYYSTPSEQWNAVPLQTPDVPLLDIIEQDTNLNVTFDNSTNKDYGAYRTLTNYLVNVTVTDAAGVAGSTDSSYSVVVDLNQNSQVFDMPTLNGVQYTVDISAQYTYDDGFGHTGTLITGLNTTTNLIPYGKPIINKLDTTVGFYSGDVQFVVDPNGRSLSETILVGIPDAQASNVSANWNYVNMMDNIDLDNAGYGARVGELMIQYSDPFNTEGSGNSVNLAYLFATNAAGTTQYNEDVSGSEHVPSV